MNKLIHRTIYFLLTTLVINAGGWTFNKEAVADVWLDEQYSLAAVDVHASADPEVTQSVSHTIPCNHWCHSIGHFVGLHSQIEQVMPEFANAYSPQQSLFIHFSFPNSLYRPPRLLS